MGTPSPKSFTSPREVFDLPPNLSAKADPRLIADDERHLATIAESLEAHLADLTERLATLRSSVGGKGRRALDRDQQIHHITGRLRSLRRFGLDVCLGKMVPADGSPPVYIGRFGLGDRTGNQLLIDWRTPAAEPFFGATRANPMGLASRRRYRWTDGRITDYWDEVFAWNEPDAEFDQRAALDDESAFIASLGGSRSPQMRDVLGTIAADQDAIIRAGSEGTLVVDGGPGTGKTVVALHRTAYLLHADARVGQHRGGVLFVGPHQPYLSYVADVLPSLGEEGVELCTVRDLVAEGHSVRPEPDSEIARLKSSVELVRAIEPAVQLYEEPPTRSLLVETYWDELTLTARDWKEAFDWPDAGTPHNQARDQVWEQLLTICLDKHDDSDPDVTEEMIRDSLLHNEDLVTTFGRAWPLLQATDLVGDLWEVPAYLRRCAPSLTEEQVQLLQRPGASGEGAPRDWTEADLPLLDAARLRLGDPEAARRARRRLATAAAERERMDQVVADILAANDDPDSPVPMLRGDDLRDALVDPGALPGADPDVLAGPFAHIVVDEAQELTDAQWLMLLARCPSRSFTVVGDRAQARHGFTESWTERLTRVGLDRVDVAQLTINYRTPAEVMAEAEPVIRRVLPDANVPTSIRPDGLPVRRGPVSELAPLLRDWLADSDDGIACVVSATPQDEALLESVPSNRSRVRVLAPELVKGLEFDLVVLIDPESFGTGITGGVDRYVAMTRATRQLVILAD